MQIDTLLASLHETLAKQHYGDSPVELYEPIRYIMDLGGKRLRPLLTLLGANLYTDDLQPFILPALGIEVFHNFTLMHDDIMDKAPLRRGNATVHTRWNENIAILSGDVMLVKAYQLFMHAPDAHLRTVLELFSICATEVCEGQQLDMNFETLPKVSEEAYIEMIRLKTAVLLGFALALGAVLTGSPASDVQALKALGENMGIGFQLKDDLLDVFGSADKVGKQVGGDILANKKTFLLIEALERATGKQRETLDFWLNATAYNPQEKVEAVTKIYRELEIDTLTETKIQHYFDLGYAQLDALHAPDEKKAQLRGFMDWLIAREH
jgi:geranylgeranyl diphosphate synthase type II